MHRSANGTFKQTLHMQHILYLTCVEQENEDIEFEQEVLQFGGIYWPTSS